MTDGTLVGDTGTLPCLSRDRNFYNHPLPDKVWKQRPNSSEGCWIKLAKTEEIKINWGSGAFFSPFSLFLDLHFYIHLYHSNFTPWASARHQKVKQELSTAWCKAFQATCSRHLFFIFCTRKKYSLLYMSALTGGCRDRNDRGIMEYCSGHCWNTLSVFKFQSLVSLRTIEALLPPLLHTAAELIKTLTFNKTAHYHNNIKPPKEKKNPWAALRMHPEWMFFFFLFFLQDGGTSRFPHANHAVCLRVYCIVRILCGPWHLSPVFFQTSLFADLSVLDIKTSICMKANSSDYWHNTWLFYNVCACVCV